MKHVQMFVGRPHSIPNGYVQQTGLDYPPCTYPTSVVRPSQHY